MKKKNSISNTVYPAISNCQQKQYAPMLLLTIPHSFIFIIIMIFIKDFSS